MGWLLHLILFQMLHIGVIVAKEPQVEEWNIDQFKPLTWGESPGLKTRITKKGFDYATTKAMNVLSRSMIRLMTIHNVHGKSGDVEYWLSSMSVRSLSKAKSNIAPTSIGLEWTTNGLVMMAKGLWKYDYRKGKERVSDHGSLDITISGVNFRFGINIGKSGGSPLISPRSCVNKIGNVSLNFYGGAPRILDLFKHKVSVVIQNDMQRQLCGILKRIINVDATLALRKLKLQVGIAYKFVFDFSLLNRPEFTSQYMDTLHKGKVILRGSNGSVPFPAPPLSSFSTTYRMFYIEISDYVFNSMAYAAHVNGFLMYNLTKKDLPNNQTQKLNTTCTSGICIGLFIRELRRTYPESTVQLRLYTTTAPYMNITSRNISVQTNGTIVFDLQLPNNTYVYNIVTLNASMETNIRAGISSGKICANIVDMVIKAKVDDKRSKIKNIAEGAILFITDSVVGPFVQSNLAKLGSYGFPLPMTDQARFTNPSITLAKNTMIVATDIMYG